MKFQAILLLVLIAFLSSAEALRGSSQTRKELEDERQLKPGTGSENGEAKGHDGGNPKGNAYHKGAGKGKGNRLLLNEKPGKGGGHAKGIPNPGKGKAKGP
ncbi:MAG: hypothetical protein SGILL_006991 [Bacillariaceae sp.]